VSVFPQNGKTPSISAAVWRTTTTKKGSKNPSHQPNQLMHLSLPSLPHFTVLPNLESRLLPFARAPPESFTWGREQVI